MNISFYNSCSRLPSKTERIRRIIFEKIKRQKETCETSKELLLKLKVSKDIRYLILRRCPHGTS